MKKCIITINREYGSGGRIIAKDLAYRLQIPFYDEELINLMVKETGLASDYIKNVERKRSPSFFTDISFSYDNLPLEDQVSVSETDIVRQVALNSESCVIVGLCADYVLRDMDNLINVFIHAPFDERVERVRDVYGVREKKLERYIRKTDRGRKNYYQYSTGRDFTSAENYDIVINSSIGLDMCTDLISAFVEIKERELNEQ